MKVLHINFRSDGGGSARASRRIHETMLRLGIESSLTVGRCDEGSESVARAHSISDGWLLKGLDRSAMLLQRLLGLEDVFYPSTYALAFRRRFREADVVQLYNTHGGYFAFTALRMMSKRKPMVWRLSDMWPMTGHCPYPGACDRWITGCDRCGRWGQYPPTMTRDRTRFHWHLKKAVYKGSRLCFVAPSSWMLSQARKSPLIAQCPIRLVPNGIETDMFRPLNKKSARDVWSLPESSFVVMLMTTSFYDERKGGQIIGDVLARLRSASIGRPIRFVVVGENSSKAQSVLKEEPSAVFTGPVTDRRLMATLYSCADVFLHPAIEENLANTAMESLACGTPVVCFDVGGMGDVVKHGITGFLSPIGDVVSMSQNVIRVAELLPVMAATMSSQCRDPIVSSHTAEMEAKTLIGIYERLLRRS